MKEEWGGGDRKREQGDNGDREKRRAALYKDFLNGSVQFYENKNLLPQNTRMCQKKATLICRLINEPPLTKIDRRPSSRKQY